MSFGVLAPDLERVADRARVPSGDRAAELYERFMQLIARWRALSPEDTRKMWLRVGQPYIWWALREIADALGSSIRGSYDLLPPSGRPKPTPGRAPLTSRCGPGVSAAISPGMAPRRALP